MSGPRGASGPQASDHLAASSDYRAKTPARFSSSTRRSLYLPMRDGVRIAVDVHLPDGLGSERVPTILRQTRYCRALLARRAFRPLLTAEKLDRINGQIRSVFLSRGYAWLDVDVRGSGASFGQWTTPWSADEVRDGADIVDWIVAQPWSSGLVGSTGNSYDGTAAELLLANQHPAVRAIAPRCSLFDVYADIAFPGGVHQTWFTQSWTRLNQSLDANQPARGVAELFALAEPRINTGLPRKLVEAFLSSVLAGVRPVEGEDALLAEALLEHRHNRDVHANAMAMQYRDDPDPAGAQEGTIDSFSPSSHLSAIKGSGAAVLSISGWFDGAYPHAAIKRHVALAGANDRLILGPWNHGITVQASPHAGDRRASFDLAGELLRFFDHHLRGISTGIEREPSARYFTMGDERWRSSAAWPPRKEANARLYLHEGRALSATAPSHATAHDEYAGNDATTSGHRTRWRTLVSPYVVPDYPDRIERDRTALVYRSPPLTAPLVVSGHPLLTLHLSTSAADGAVFAYLEEETADGRVLYVTEGLLRLIHRAVSDAPPYASPSPYRTFTRRDARPLSPDAVERVLIDLLPVSHAFRVGSRVRLALTAADRDHFAAPPPPHYAVHRAADRASVLELPLESER